jgi:hypothetical protein
MRNRKWKSWEATEELFAEKRKKTTVPMGITRCHIAVLITRYLFNQEEFSYFNLQNSWKNKAPLTTLLRPS